MSKSQVLKSRVFSGIQPTGNLHIGNYLGAIKQFVKLQDESDAIFCVVDEHAITVPQDPEELRRNTLGIAMAYLAAGIDPDKSIIFVQSHVPADTELGWILNTMTPLGELERMTQFKEKKLPLPVPFAPRLQTEVTERPQTYAGLLNYPTLMAADILLYQTDIVPVGEDQKQHIELTRSLAERFNNRFGETFKIPKIQLKKETARIMGLDDPIKKMSKSAASEYNYISLLDSRDIIQNKIKKAVTDSGNEIKYDPESKPAISNLLAIAAEFSNKSIPDLEKDFDGKTYSTFKEAVAEHIIDGLQTFQNNYRDLEKNKDHVLDILQDGAKRANEIANETLREVKQKIGFLV